MTTDPVVRRAFIHGCITVALALAAVVAGVGAHGSARTVLLAACPLIMLAGAVVAGVRTYRAYQADDRWPVWQALLWFLLTMALLTFMSVGPELFGLTAN
ncbi:hypothetical protein HUN08_04165 [Gordonia sp. X0973]|uniref:hypothetical protein n=1 Tax=Gordonia sp. X0973 TaxID=2742602 RepID=UPI000F51DDDE|nr:hypothetical protein [Gordonia sp. X0973]QKT06472.1 hypothetical protein HUN08_04165 [Gordonia sp. X0973]